MQVYLVDEAGYLSDEFPAQKNRKRPGEYLLPPDAILTPPNKQEGYWPKWNKENKTWSYEKIPTCAEDFLSYPPISHKSQSPRDIKYRALIDKFKDEDENIILKRGKDDLSWYMERKPEKTLEELRTEKLEELNSTFSQVEQTAHVESSLGFTINADETANRNLEGLTTVMTDEEVRYFCDYHNEMHPVNKEDCTLMRKELIDNGQNLYKQKWAIRDQINQAQSKEELEKIQIEFVQTSYAVKE